MDIYNMTQAQREADLAHIEAVKAVRAAEEASMSARRAYLDATEEVATMIEDIGSDALRVAIYRAIDAARKVGTADEAVSTAKARLSGCALRARILAGTLTPSDLK